MPKSKNYVATKIVIAVSLLMLYVLLTFVLLSNKPITKIVLNSTEEFPIYYREDIKIKVSPYVIDVLNNAYNKNFEFLYCLIGKENGNVIYVENVIEPEFIYKDEKSIISSLDPACQYPESLGGIHSHPGDCRPSSDDLFSWGEMRNPEPIINGIQCGINEFYIVLMPKKYESLDFRSLRVLE